MFTARRVAIYAAVLLFGYAVFMAKGYTNQLWLTDADGTGKATDFLPTWAAARLAVAGQAAAAYDLAALTREQLAGVGQYGGGYSWAYPPTYFLLIAPLGLFSYAAATLIWLFGTLSAYLVAVHAILPRKATVFAALVSPFVLWNFFAGQNAFLTAALIAGTLVLLDRRPIVAGILLGLLTCKPQLGILFPLILILTGRWRVFTAAAATTVLLGALSVLFFGLEAWTAFFAALHEQGGVVLGGEVAFSKQQSVHALVRLLGGGDALAAILHIAVAAAAAGFSAWLWLRPVDFRLKAASLVAAALIATPYLFSYDLPILTVALIFLASLGIASNGGEGGFIPGERTLIAVLTPLLLLLPGKPVGVPLLALLILLIVLRLRMKPAGRGPSI
ncbi:hypothetical protein DLREEDagr8_19600 [Dongia sp. agr-C8]